MAHEALDPAFRRLIDGITAYLHADGSWVEGTRLAIRVEAETRYEGGHTHRRHLSFEEDGRPAALGFDAAVDALVIDFSPTVVDGTLVGVEINASHAARELPRGAWCGPCLGGLPTHCEDRLVLGIHALPGGFAPWILAPVGALVPLPRDLDPLVATLLEPFAAAWHAVRTVAPRAGER